MTRLASRQQEKIWPEVDLELLCSKLKPSTEIRVCERAATHVMPKSEIQAEPLPTEASEVGGQNSDFKRQDKSALAKESVAYSALKISESCRFK